MSTATLQAELKLDAKATLGEGAIWHPTENKLYWIDIEGQQLYIYDPETGINESYNMEARIGTVVPIAAEGVLVALQNGIHSFDVNSGQLTLINQPLTDPEIRFNDGKCDPAGRFWVGSMHLKQTEGKASMYRMDSDGSVHTMFDSATISNGLAWSSDKTKMYYVDSPLHRVDVFDYDNATGNISNRRTAIRIPDDLGDPDGMCIDANDTLWIALWGSNAVGRFDPINGKLLEKVKVPAPQISSCTFGGEQLDTLYITSARENMSETQLTEHPSSGGLFAVKTPYKGVPAHLFKKAF